MTKQSELHQPRLPSLASQFTLFVHNDRIIQQYSVTASNIVTKQSKLRHQPR